MSHSTVYKELGGYGRLEGWMVADRRLTWAERAVLACVTQHIEAEGSCHMSFRDLARTLGMGRGTVCDAAEWLEIFGIVTVEDDDWSLMRPVGAQTRVWVPWYHSLSCVLPHRYLDQAVLSIYLHRNKGALVGPISHNQLASLLHISRSEAQGARRRLVNGGLVTYNLVTGPHVDVKAIMGAMASAPTELSPAPLPKEPRIISGLGEYGRLERWMLDVRDGLTWAQLAVLAYVAGKTEAMGACRPSVRAIMRDLHMSQLTVMGAIERLRGLHLIERHGRDWRVVRPEGAEGGEWWPWYHSVSRAVTGKWFEQAVLCYLLFLDANGISGPVSHGQVGSVFGVGRSQAQRARGILSSLGVISPDATHVDVDAIASQAGLPRRRTTPDDGGTKREKAPCRLVATSAKTGELIEPNAGALRYGSTRPCRKGSIACRMRSFVRRADEDVRYVEVTTEEPWASKAIEYMATHPFPFTVEGAKSHHLVDLSDDDDAPSPQPPAAPLPKARPDVPVRPQLTYGEQLALSLDVLDSLDDDDIPY